METMETRIKAMEDDIKAIKEALGISNVATSAPATPANGLSLKQRVTNMLHEIGIPTHIKGYSYVRQAIIVAVNNPDIINAITKELYPQVAEAFNTTPSRVERAVRHAIEIAWCNGDMDILHKYFGYTISPNKGKPTNSQFISLLADSILMGGYYNEMD